ncbi:MAG: FAD-dependent oxidoreductase [Streptococcus sp.]|nr:FAD-dependent oxidoreductase [Streptococcus sp.]
MKKVAIIGAGIVGSTSAYYLSKSSEWQVTVFDEGIGQATKAAAGIISPWFSKRRNKAWYQMARLGADFYQVLIRDLQKDSFETDFYQQTGVYILKKDESKLSELYELARARREQSPLIGDLDLLSQSQVRQQFPYLRGFDTLLYASGGARVEGAQLTKTLLEASHAKIVQKRVSFKKTSDHFYLIEGEKFDAVILSAGAWLPELLQPFSYLVDIRPQKGQLRDYKTHLPTEQYPVVMPEGEIDIIPFNSGKFSIGATHENDQGYDLQIDEKLLSAMQEEASLYFPIFDTAKVLGSRVGTRAYTSDFSPFFGECPELPKVYLASGLGSSGLTTGPLIGHQLAQMILENDLLLQPKDYPVEKYLKKQR